MYVLDVSTGRAEFMLGRTQTLERNYELGSGLGWLAGLRCSRLGWTSRQSFFGPPSENHIYILKSPGRCTSVAELESVR